MNLIKKVYFIFYFSFLRRKLKKQLNVNIKPGAKFDKFSKFEGYNVVGNSSDVSNSVIGLGSYFGVKCKLPNTIVGRFCSIAHNIEILPFTHPSKGFVSTHPSFFSKIGQAGFTFVNNQLFEETLFIPGSNRFHLKIGNDVWIGANVTFIGGIEIGDGAIIAAGSVVTRDVAPFSIVGGVPAKHIKFRFEQDQINFLKDHKWWEKDFYWLEKNVHHFTNINEYIKIFRS